MKYEYGVEYETKGEKPDLPDDVKLEVKNKSTKNWYGGIDFTCKFVIWENVLSFRIVDERYKPNANDWHERGELPPVGTECEYFDQITKKWSKVWTVASHAFDDEAVLFCNESKTGAVFYGYKGSFRPIRTERDVLVDKMESDAETFGSNGAYQRLIDKGYRKVKQQTEDEFIDYGYGAFSHPESARKAYRAGCRFVERELREDE